MEGGTDFDLTVLDQVVDEERDGNRSRNNSESIAMERYGIRFTFHVLIQHIVW